MHIPISQHHHTSPLSTQDKTVHIAATQAHTLPCHHSRGFTLLEVLVALAILAIALSALIKTSSENSANASYLRDKTLAHWVAMNKAAEMEITHAWPKGSSNGVIEFARQEWRWTISTEKTESEKIRRYTVEVRYDADNDSPLSTVTGFLKKPETPGAAQ